jgi:hypothetical protein
MTDGQLVSLSWNKAPIRSLTTTFLLLSHTCGFIDMGRSLSREDGSVVYSLCWPSPAQWFTGPRPAELLTIFYCLRLETPSTWRATSPYLYTLGMGWPSYTPKHWISFSSPPTTRRVTMEVFEPTSTRDWTTSESWVLSPESWVLSPESWVLSPESWVLSPEVSCYNRRSVGQSISE